MERIAARQEANFFGQFMSCLYDEKKAFGVLVDYNIITPPKKCLKCGKEEF